LQVLEDFGVLSKIKRFAGTSVGSIAAGILAVGGTTSDVERIFVEGNVAKLVYGEFIITSRQN
jgi:predicted acylesterase/phospholipase RssA